MMLSDPLPESAVLRSRNPSSTDSDDWPEFRLQDAVVTLPDSDSDEPTSLLVASEHYPVTLTGRLEPPSKAQAHLYLRKDGGKKGTPTVVEDVRGFAYGSYEDGSVEIWAAGKAGWFVIQPGRAYRKVYQNMCDAVKMLFFVADAYSQPQATSKGKNGLSAEGLFKKYADEEIGAGAKWYDAADIVYKHHDFLLSSMLAGKEGIAWPKNPLFKHLAKNFAVSLRTIQQRIAPPAQQKPESKAVRQARQGSVETTSRSSSLKRKRGRPPKDQPTDVISIGSSSAASKDLPQRTAPARSEQQSSKPAPKAAPPASRRTRNNSQALPRSPTPEIQESATPAHDSDSDDAAPRHASKGKSALRLKPSKPTKGPPRSGKAPVLPDDEPRSSPIAPKRRCDDPPEPRHAKRRNSRQEVDEGIDIPESSSSPSSTEPSAGADRRSPPPLANSLATHKPDPLQESTWICALDGCTHKVYGDPSSEIAQRLIREHYALHAYDDDQRVQMVKRLGAPSLPVERLMERVKEGVRGEGFPGSLSSTVLGTRFPEPLKSRY